MKLTYQEWLEQAIEDMRKHLKDPMSKSIYEELTGSQPIGETTQKILKDSYNNGTRPDLVIADLM